MGKSKSGKKVIGSAEERWGLSKRFRPEAPSIPNEHLMQDLIVTFGRERNEVVETLLLYPRNVDCIVDDAQRKAVCSWLGVTEPSMTERVMYVKDQIAKSSGTGDTWAALLVKDKIADLPAYHKLRYQRLDEQVGRSLTQERYRRNKTTANKSQEKSKLVMRVEHIGNVNIQRDHTGLEGFDLLGGQEKKNPETIGFCVGDLVLVGGEAGVGKTKMLLQAMSIASGPFVNDTALYMQSEFDLPTFKAKYCEGVIQGDEDLFISAANTMEDIIEAIYQTKPRWVVIDSKDKVQECRTSAGWERFQRRMREVARDVKCTIFIVTHLNQGGDIYGGSKIKHDVDVVMLLTKQKDVPNCFRAAVPSKNRGGIANPEHYSLWTHIPNGVVCLRKPPRWMDSSPVANNPLLDKPPESISEEENIRREMDDLLEKVKKDGLEKMTEQERERLAHITDWLTRKDSKDYQEKLRENKAKTREEAKRKKEEEDASKGSSSAPSAGDVEDEFGLDDDDNDPEHGEDWKNGKGPKA